MKDHDDNKGVSFYPNANVTEMKRRFVQAELEKKKSFLESAAADAAFPLFFTCEVLDILQISYSTLRRIRIAIAIENGTPPQEASRIPSRKCRYSALEINRIRDYIKRKNAYHSPLETMNRE